MPPGISLSDFYYILPELVLTAGALLVLVADVLLPKGSRALAWVTLAALGATLVSLIPFIHTHVEVANGLIAVDGFSLFFKILFLIAAVMTVLMSVRYLEVEGASPGEYYFLILCATLGMMIMAGGIDLITSFIGLETMAVSFYILAGFIKPNQKSNEAAVKYFLLGAFSLGILLYGMSLLYGLSGTTNLRVMAKFFVGQERDPLLVLAVILVVVGMGFKIAAVPFHMWAPDVYEGAPTPVTAFLSVGSKAAAFAMLLRIFLEGVPSMDADWRLLFEVLAIITMIVGNVAALTQSNIKRLLAYSSIAHAGYLMMGIVAGHDARRDGDADLPGDLFVHAVGRLHGDRAAAPQGHRRRGSQRLQRSAFPQPLCGVRDVDLHAVAGRHSADRRVHGEVLAVWRRHRCGLRVDGGHRRADQCAVALLLHPDRGLHVSEERDHRFGAGDQPGAGIDAGRGGTGDARCSASIPASCSNLPRRRRGRSGPAACRRRSAERSARPRSSAIARRPAGFKRASSAGLAHRPGW